MAQAPERLQKAWWQRAAGVYSMTSLASHFERWDVAEAPLHGLSLVRMLVWRCAVRSLHFMGGGGICVHVWRLCQWLVRGACVRVCSRSRFAVVPITCVLLFMRWLPWWWWRG